MAESETHEAVGDHLADPSHPDKAARLLDLAVQSPEAVRRALEERLPSVPVPGRLTVPEHAPVARPTAPDVGPYSAPPVRTAPASNWGGNIEIGAAEARQPVNTGQACSTLALAVANKLRARGIGASHSSSIVLSTPGVLVDSGTLTTPESSATNSGLRQCRELVPSSWYSLAPGALAQHVEVGSGARVQDVLDYLSASNRALPMTGSYTGQTLVGAFMTSTHGAGVIHPPLQAAVRSIQMLTVNAVGVPQELRIEPSAGITEPSAYRRDMPHVVLVQDDEVFQAAVVSMGCFGVIVSVVIETVAPFFLAQESMLTSWQEARRILSDVGPDGIPHYFKDTYNGGVLLSPYSFLGRQNTILSRTHLRSTPPPGSEPPGGGGMSPLLVLLARLIANYAPELTPLAINLSIGLQSVAPVWGPGNQITGSATELPKGFSAEHGFPVDGLLPALDALLAQMGDLAKKQRYLVGPISVRYVGATGAFLSMTNGGPRAFTELLTLAGAGAGGEVLAAVEPTALDHGSRPHWGQWWSAEAVPRIVSTYPEYGRWKAVWQRLDPTGVFHNELTDRLP